MHIKTERGWVQLQPRCENHVYRRMTWDFKTAKFQPDANGTMMRVETTDRLPPAITERNGYDGGFPSQSLCDFVNRMKEDHMKYFDDGERMRYSKWGGRV